MTFTYKNSIIRALAVVSISIVLVGCKTRIRTTVTSGQSASNASLLARTVENYAWSIDPEIYFSDYASDSSHFLWAPPRLMTDNEFKGSLSRYSSDYPGGPYTAKESRLFALAVPLKMANAFDGDSETAHPAQICLLVTALYKSGKASYLFQFFAAPIAKDSRYNQLVFNGRAVAAISRGSVIESLAIPVRASDLVKELKRQGLPTDFPVELYDSYRGYWDGSQLMIGSAYITAREERVVKGYPDYKTEISARRLKTLEVFVRGEEGLSAKELYSGLLNDKEFRSAMSKKTREISSWNRSQAKRVANKRKSEAEQARREERARWRQNRERTNRIALESLSEQSREFSSWQRRQSMQMSLGSSNYAYISAQQKKTQQEIDRKLAESEANERIAASRRKDAAMKREADARRAKIAKEKALRDKEKKAKLEDEKKDLQDKWKDFFIQQRLVQMKGDEKAEINKLISKSENLERETVALNKKLKAAGVSPMAEGNNKIWVDINRKMLAKRAKGIREQLFGFRGPMGKDKWEEHYLGQIDGIKFYQRVRLRTFPDRVVDLGFRVVNTTKHPYWHQLDESKVADGRFYLWGGSTIQPGKEKSHEWVTYPKDRTEWKFTGFVRRED